MMMLMMLMMMSPWRCSWLGLWRKARQKGDTTHSQQSQFPGRRESGGEGTTTLVRKCDPKLGSLGGSWVGGGGDKREPRGRIGPRLASQTTLDRWQGAQREGK